jgi:hypothetical protein
MHSAAPASSAVTAQYAVPKRFGMAGILALTTLMAVLFGLLRSVGAHPFVYVFVGVLALVTCLVQMRYGEVPRVASMLAGAVVMPLCGIGFAMVAVFVDERISIDDLSGMICMLPLAAAFGAGFGYLAGAATAGLFLLIDLAESYSVRGGGRLRYARPSPPRRQFTPHMPGYLTARPLDADPHQAEIITAMLAAENPFAPTRAIQARDDLPSVQPPITAETADRSSDLRDDDTWKDP